MNYGIGLDIGIASVGWAALELDSNLNPVRIIKMNSYIFNAAEHPKDGASLALPRREARGARRRLRRRQHRKERIRNLIINEGLISLKEMDGLFDGQLKDIYELRKNALDEKLSNQELARILIHLAQRRGFRSNRKNDTSDKESGKILKAVSENQRIMDEQGFRTAGEMFCKDIRFTVNKRNKSENYISTVQRDMIESEAHQIFEAQRGFGNDFLTTAFEEKYVDILLSQRSFEDGPASGPYSGDQIWKMVGLCTFEKNVKRTAKAAYSFEYFNLLQKVNHIKLNENGSVFALNDEQRNRIIALAHKSPSPTYASIRKELFLPDSVSFNIRYGPDREKSEKSEKFEFLKAYHEMRKALDKISKGYINSVSREKRNQIGHIFTVFKTDDTIKEKLQKEGFNQYEIDVLTENLSSFKKFGHLSTIACDKIIPGLERGMTYDKACEAAGYKFKGHSGNEKAMLISLKHLQEEAENITSPVVKRALSCTAKVINAIIREMGESPCYINIELARELSKTRKDRDASDKGMRENQAYNNRLMEEIKTVFKIPYPSGIDLVKLKLYKEQAGVCLYSLKQFDTSRLFENGYTEIDHIIPYSISFDDTYSNKALVFTGENRKKGNRLPMQYLTGKAKDDFQVWIKNNHFSEKKRNNLLKTEITEEDLENFKERNLTDTKTITRFLFNYINDYLQFNENNPKKHKINPVNGAVTSAMRKRWGLKKIREDGDLHHAVDAVAIASITPALIQSVTKYAKYKEVKYLPEGEEMLAVDVKTGEVIEKFPQPWHNFRKELEARVSNDPLNNIRNLKLLTYGYEDIEKLKPAFVARMPRRKATGSVHQETIKSPKLLDNENYDANYLIKKVDLKKLKLDKNGEIDGYYSPESDPRLYSALKNRLSLFGGNAEKAFSEPFFKPRKNGAQGPLVKKVKLLEKSTLNVPVHGGNGAADNGSMLRVDVFNVDGKYYLIPIYLSDTAKKELPNKAIIAYKNFDEWKEMDDKDFIFSLYPNDLFYVKHKKEMVLSVCQKDSTLDKTIVCKDGYFYYIGTDISKGSITMINHDNSYKIFGLGVKTLEAFEKCQIDVLGNITKVGKEKRVGFNKVK